ncbi:hypothetical protein CBM2592_A160210 [Cupriavidus taiwanensis]|nr:hypothetical protein CBM2588_A120291 [Cupriavidus taiwanensis]SOY45827.1 hypothetical protein CBM2592_A160210 [Cupriavidus taiwanensis]SOY81285.1 hypothetical protein CBM2591_A190209 [Cupriavidus taiwanensis]SOZ54198.1 hypothetical protein CBM2617_A170121 [Cupriavidus taiwanensis]SOZ77833.1 hypothetical protein CBM2622_A150289 [Cupriavidus taiwanensis]
MVARSTWSGRERSSHSRFPPVPRVRLVHLTLPFGSTPSLQPVYRARQRLAGQSLSL